MVVHAKVPGIDSPRSWRALTSAPGEATVGRNLTDADRRSVPEMDTFLVVQDCERLQQLLGPPRVNAPKPITFDDACRQLAAFLAAEGRPTVLRWFCREDATGYRRRVRVLASTPDTNRSLYEGYYRYGAIRGLGLRLEATLYTENTSWCHVWCPQDELDASQAMMGGSLHFSASTSPLRTTIHDRVSLTLWRALDDLRGPSPFLVQIPQRRWLQALLQGSSA
jgi:hypothetical protein